MKRPKFGIALTAAALAAMHLGAASAVAALGDGLVSYWPMEEVLGTKTPDKVSGYDMDLNNLTAADLVAGKVGKCFSFDSGRQTLLSRIHAAADDLPANKHAAFTVAFWANANGTGQTDLRLFSEAFAPNNTNPLFNIGTDSGGASGSVDLYIRQAGWPDVNHIKTTAQPLDGTWHHITFVQQTDGTRRFYIDGVADDLEIAAKPEGIWNVNNTTIGGILRASASHWVTGLIDEVTIWKRALADAEITQVKDEGLASLFPPEAEGLVAHWPMEEVLGTKTPDKVSGYDMDLNNLTAADLVAGKVGKCFTFDSARQTLLSRIHAAADDLPANKHAAFTVAFWANANGTGQTDLRLFSEAFAPNNTNPLFNIGTDSGGASGSVDLYIRQAGWPDVNHIKTTAQPLDGTWHHITFVQQADGTRRIYIDGVADDLEIAAKPEGTWNLNNTTIGGILRASASHWVTGLIDEVAVWKRALSDAEITRIKDNGVPATFTKVLPLELSSFTAEFPAVAVGEKILLRWDGSKDAAFSIDSGVGDVTAQSNFGVGSKEVTINAPTTFTLTASRGGETVSRQVTVKTVAGVASGWHLLDTFELWNPGNVFTQSDWLGAEGVFNVVEAGGTKALGFNDGNDLTALRLNSFSIREGQRGTVSFRIYAAPALADEVSIPPITVHVGLTERSIRFNGDFNQNVGPYIRIERFVDVPSIDIQARNGVATGFYEGAALDAIQPGTWYRIWIDVENRPFNVVDGVQNGGDIYSVHIQKEGDAARTTLFENFLADRDAVTIDPALGAPTPDLIYFFISAPGAGQGDNRLLIDEVFISVGANNASVPYKAVTGPTSIQISGTGVDRVSNRFTLTWDSQPGVVYTVQRRDTVTGAWTAVATGYPTGGATGASTSYSEVASQSAAFYRVVFQP